MADGMKQLNGSFVVRAMSEAQSGHGATLQLPI